MRYRKLTTTGDFTFGAGATEYLVDSPDCVAQAVLTALLLHQGEWFLDVTVGVPWETEVIGYGTRALYDAAIKAAILGVQGVNSIISYSSFLDTVKRALSITATIETIFGIGAISPVFTLTGYGISPYQGGTPYGGG